MASLTFTNYSSEKLTNFLLDIMRRKENRKLWRLFSLSFCEGCNFHPACSCWGKIDLLLDLKLILLHNFRFSTIGVINPIAHCIHVGARQQRLRDFISIIKIFYPFFNLTDFSWPKSGLFLRFIFSWVALMVSYNTLLCIAIWVEIVS